MIRPKSTYRRHCKIVNAAKLRAQDQLQLIDANQARALSGSFSIGYLEEARKNHVKKKVEEVIAYPIIKVGKTTSPLSSSPTSLVQPQHPQNHPSSIRHRPGTKLSEA